MQRLLTSGSRLFLRTFVKPVLGSKLPPAVRRRWLATVLRIARPPKGVERSELWAGDVRMLRLRAAGGDGAVADVGPIDAAQRDAIMYIHGGAFVAGGDDAYAGFASWLALYTGADVYLPDYRLAPEHPQPAATDDLFAAWQAVLELGYDPARSAFAGDSAGGGLAVSTALLLPEMDVPSPAALVLISPFLDLSLSGSSMVEKAADDPMLSAALLHPAAVSYADGLNLTDPRISPLFAELRRLPPILIQAGTDDILIDDSTRFADRAWAAGVEVELQQFPGMWHDFQTQARLLEVSRGALEDIAAFLRRRAPTFPRATSTGTSRASGSASQSSTQGESTR